MLILILKILACILIAWLLTAYVLLPLLWRHYEHNPQLEHAPKTTQTAIGRPGDPLNIALIGNEDELINAFLLAGWVPADPISFSSSRKIIWSVLAKKAYPSAPVSNLFLWKRKQDLAFERESGHSAKARHHVRFWKTEIIDSLQRPLWIGAATYDFSVGLSHYTGQVTHHISPDIDQERDQIIADLNRAKQLTLLYSVTGIGPTWRGKNGGGDLYFSDGEIWVGALSPGNAEVLEAPQTLDSPWPTAVIEQSWDALGKILNLVYKKAESGENA